LPQILPLKILQTFLNEMNSKLKQTEEKIEKEYHVSWYIILYKLVLGLVEFLSGISLALFSKPLLKFYTARLTQELSEEPHDLLANFSERIIPSILTHHGYIVLYLTLLGSAKIAGAIGLIFGKNWGVDLLVTLTVIMFPFQFVNLILHPSLIDFFYITIGILIALYLIEFKPRAWISRVLLQLGK
jgi:uncharacterized membrane protein